MLHFMILLILYTVYQFIESFLDKKMPTFEGYGAFKERSAEDFMSSVLNDAFAILFSDFLYKNVCCGYSFELP